MLLDFGPQRPREGVRFGTSRCRIHDRGAVQHVQHLVSRVEGELVLGTTLSTRLRRCPRRDRERRAEARAMEIPTTSKHRTRPYAGSSATSPHGNVDTATRSGRSSPTGRRLPTGRVQGSSRTPIRRGSGSRRSTSSGFAGWCVRRPPMKVLIVRQLRFISCTNLYRAIGNSERPGRLSQRRDPMEEVRQLAPDAIVSPPGQAIRQTARDFGCVPKHPRGGEPDDADARGLSRHQGLNCVRREGRHAVRILHGKTSLARHDGRTILRGSSESHHGRRYHSLRLTANRCRRSSN